MMKFPIKYQKLAVPVLVLVQSLLLAAIFVLQIKQQSINQQILQNVSCDYFTNVTEWAAGSETIVSIGFTTDNELSALRGYKDAIYDWKGLCEQGLCLDSCRVQLYKSCPDNTSIEVIRDTFIYF